MENFIVSKKYQKFFINKKKFYFKKGEKIQVEISNKFTISNFNKLAKSSSVFLTAESLIELKIIKIDTIPPCDWIFINSAFALNSIMYLKSSFK